MTPIYDVLSAEPWVAKRELVRQKLKLAMSVGKSKHYRLQEIMPRHWRETAKLAKLPEREVDQIFTELLTQVPQGSEKIAKVLPAKFPAVVSDPIFEGIRNRLELLRD